MLFNSAVDEDAEQRDLVVIIWFPEGKTSFQTFPSFLAEGLCSSPELGHCLPFPCCLLNQGNGQHKEMLPHQVTHFPWAELKQFAFHF